MIVEQHTISVHNTIFEMLVVPQSRQQFYVDTVDLL
jgi:hypothetical protein